VFLKELTLDDAGWEFLHHAGYSNWMKVAALQFFGLGRRHANNQVFDRVCLTSLRDKQSCRLK
jgi:hypothetical protein